MGWDRLTLPQGAVDGSISWIRAWEKLLVHPPSASMELVFGAARGVPMSHGLHRGAVRSPSRPGQANDDHWWGGMQSTLLKLTGRVVNDRVSLSITRRRRPHIALGGCRREYKTLIVVFDGFLPRLNSVKTRPLYPPTSSGFSVLFCRLYFIATSGVCLIRSGTVGFQKKLQSDIAKKIKL